jgi:hypothetical protein
MYENYKSRSTILKAKKRHIKVNEICSISSHGRKNVVSSLYLCVVIEILSLMIFRNKLRFDKEERVKLLKLTRDQRTEL